MNVAVGDDDNNTVKVSTRTLFQAAAFLLGGGIVSGGVTFATAPEQELKDLRQVVETVALSVNEIKVEMRYARENREDLEKRLEDHEERLRELEK